MTAAFFGPALTAWLLGDLMQWRWGYYRALEERAARLEHERDAQAQIAAAAERARIARELHDVVAHNVSVMVVQADGAGYALDTAPEQVLHGTLHDHFRGARPCAPLAMLLVNPRLVPGSPDTFRAVSHDDGSKSVLGHGKRSTFFALETWRPGDLSA